MMLMAIFSIYCMYMVNFIMSIYNGHRFEIGIFSPRNDRAGWCRGSAEVPHSPVIPRVENADLKLMPIIDSF